MCIQKDMYKNVHHNSNLEAIQMYLNRRIDILLLPYIEIYIAKTIVKWLLYETIYLNLTNIVSWREEKIRNEEMFYLYKAQKLEKLL